MRHDSKCTGNDAAGDTFLAGQVSRRSLLQTIPAMMLAPVSSEVALASTDSPSRPPQKQRHIRVDQKYVLFPINNESRSRRVRLLKDGRVLRSFTASLGFPAHWWAHLDLSDWQGQTLTLTLESDNW